MVKNKHQSGQAQYEDPYADYGWGPPQNEVLTARIGADQEWLARNGVELAGWGPDPVSGKVRIYLARYTDEACNLLTDRYGDAVVVVAKPVLRLAPGQDRG